MASGNLQRRSCLHSLRSFLVRSIFGCHIPQGSCATLQAILAHFFPSLRSFAQLLQYLVGKKNTLTQRRSVTRSISLDVGWNKKKATANEARIVGLRRLRRSARHGEKGEKRRISAAGLFQEERDYMRPDSLLKSSFPGRQPSFSPSLQAMWEREKVRPVWSPFFLRRPGPTLRPSVRPSDRPGK